MIEICWIGSPHERPSFADIELGFRNMLEEVDTYPKLSELVQANGRLFIETCSSSSVSLM